VNHFFRSEVLEILFSESCAMQISKRVTYGSGVAMREPAGGFRLIWLFESGGRPLLTGHSQACPVLGI
jgi:hypothetical protein